MNRRRLWLGAAAAAGLVAGVTGALRGWAPGPIVPKEQQALDVWRLRFATPDGGDIVFGALRGRPLLLNFWATWCVPCIEELPLLDRFQSRQAALGWSVVGLAADQDDAVRRFLVRRAVRYPVALAGLAGIDLARQLGNPNGGLPYSVLFDRAGAIAGTKRGALTEADLATWSRTA